eukprot:TRINITY_DN38570_c0_g1_i1.p1 TRINITY_DN38570_c0_g1~~TRINITY_DN38570_c0_g1_i1.p1  ORF type:complete len:492 (-),score=62.55 TRINITY_DN38570_c0_g1_i1:48-1523(-)
MPPHFTRRMTHRGKGQSLILDVCAMRATAILRKLMSYGDKKNRLDEIFDSGDSSLYWRAREELFPAAPRKRRPRTAHDRASSGGSNNRAREKLAEIADAVGGLEDALPTPPAEAVFVDVCGAPGAWSNHLFCLGERRGCLMRGFGFSLRDGTNPLSCTWYKDLCSRSNFTTIWGSDGTGDICVAENIAQAVALVGTSRASIVLADGACGVGVAWGDENHLENYQEIIAGRILLAETLIMLQTLREGGHFVCKLFDTFSHVTAGLIFIVASLFHDTKIVKPRGSRVVNSERYLVGKSFRGQRAGHFEAMLTSVQAAIAAWSSPGSAGPWSGLAPVFVVSPSILKADVIFHASVRSMAETLCRRQAKALEAVIDRVVELKEPSRRGNSGNATIDDADIVKTPLPPRKRQRLSDVSDAAGDFAVGRVSTGCASGEAFDGVGSITVIARPGMTHTIAENGEMESAVPARRWPVSLHGQAVASVATAAGTTRVASC